MVKNKTVGRKKIDINDVYESYKKNAERNKYEVKPFDKWVRTNKAGEQVTGSTGESPEEKGVRLGIKRMNQLAVCFRRVINLSSPAYKFSDEQVSTMLSAVEMMKTEMETKFTKATSEKTKEGFKFD